MPQTAVSHSSIAAAWLILGKKILPDWPGWPKTMAEILSLTGSSKSQAYQIAERLRLSLATLLGKPGRPVSQTVSEKNLFQVSLAVQEFLMRHPGAAYCSASRRHYDDSFRRFVVGLLEPGQVAEGLSTAELAEATGVPLGTLKDWLTAPGSHHEPPEKTEADWLRDSHLQQIVSLFQGWRGTFQAFCQRVREQSRLNYGTTFIGNLLHNTGQRPRKAHAPKEAPWSHDTFQALFPGAQWLGDGTDITIRWGEDDFHFNLEVILDVASNALVGAAISDFEDEDVLLRAYHDAIATAEKAALALTLDNRNSNQTTRVEGALKEHGTTLLASTLGRGQSKAPLEGAFGLFQQALPDLTVAGDNPREMACSVLKLVITAWARGRNGKPRKKLRNLSPIQAYRSAHPTDQDYAMAKQHILDLQRRQELMRKTRAARADRIKLELLKQGLAELTIADLEGRLAIDLAYFSRDAIVNGLAIFEAKKRLGKLPDEDDWGRYLGGIIRNEDRRIELELTAELFLKQRRRLRDLSLQKLAHQAATYQDMSPRQQLHTFVACALDAPLAIDHHFWTAKSCECLATFPPDQRAEVYKAASRRISATFQADPHRRQSLLARLAKAFTED